MSEYSENKSRLEKTLQILSAAEQLAAPDETMEVREAIASIQINAGWLSKIFAKRHSGNVQERSY